MQCRESGADFLCALTAFIKTVLSGRCPSDMAAIFFGGRLLALNKKGGGIRPIAVGFSFRRLASKCANAFALARLSPSFCPQQLGPLEAVKQLFILPGAISNPYLQGMF